MHFVVSLMLALSTLGAKSQINDLFPPVKFGSFYITYGPKSAAVGGKSFVSVNIYKDNQLVLIDSVATDKTTCQGFSFPPTQPFSDYFIFSKHQSKAGKTYILSKRGDIKAIAGGTFWAAPKHKLLFILAEKDYRNLVVFSLKEMKTIFEKYSCDEFTDWYFRHGTYFGKVSTECGDELKTEKEVSEWMHPVEIEQFDVKRKTLNEMHITDEQVEHAKALVKYAACQ